MSYSHEDIAPVPVNIIKLDSDAPETSLPGEMTHIRIIGCEDMRQCEVSYQDGFFYLRERGVENGHCVIVGLDTLFRRSFVSIIKSNDGMEPQAALEHGLKALPGYGYLEIADAAAKKNSL